MNETRLAMGGLRWVTQPGLVGGDGSVAVFDRRCCVKCCVVPGKATLSRWPHAPQTIAKPGR